MLEHLGQRVRVGFLGVVGPLKEVLEKMEMRCRCWNPKTLKPKKMRLRSDGWKRCYRCGVEAMGLTLRAKIGLEQMARDGLLNSTPLCESITLTTRSRRLPVAWRSEVA